MIDIYEFESGSLPRVRKSKEVKVWSIVEGVNKDSGEPVKFSIQEVPEDRFEEVINFMSSYFLSDEPISKSLGHKDDPLAVDDFCGLWKELLSQGISVVAFASDPQSGKSQIAAANVLGFVLEEADFEEDDLKLQSDISKKILQVSFALGKEANLYKTYGVDKYMFGAGLCVHPSFRGQALGGCLLEAREKIGKEYKIPATGTVFTSSYSQKLAARAGYEVLVQKDYVDITDDQGNLLFPGITEETIKTMGKKLY